MRDFIQHFVGNGRDELRRDLESVDLQQVTLNLAHGHAVCIHADDMIVESRQAALVLGDELRLERREPIARDGDLSVRQKAGPAACARVPVSACRRSCMAPFTML